MKTLAALLLVTSVLIAEEWKTTASGLEYQVVKAGKEGTEPRPGNMVKVHYTGTFEDGRVFDSSRTKGSPFEFMLGMGKVIAGWDEGVALMTVGSRYRFRIPWKLAYGKGGRGGIPPKTNLNFDVELLEVKKGRPLPVFRRSNPARQKTTESGLKYQVIKDGAGDPPRLDQGVTLRFALWSARGDLISCTEMMNGQHLSGACSGLKLGPIQQKFMQEAPLLMKPGAIFRFEVPPELCWGKQAAHPKLPPNSVTVWEFELVKVNDIPRFEPSDPARVKTTASGLKYEVIREGTGRSPLRQNTVRAHYTGWLTNGKMFDSSHGRGEPSEFALGRVIAGWTEGLQLMKEGAIYRFTIPGNLAYGPRPRPGSGIPPDATLVFVVELVKVK